MYVYVAICCGSSILQSPYCLSFPLSERRIGIISRIDRQDAMPPFHAGATYGMALKQRSCAPNDLLQNAGIVGARHLSAPSLLA